MKTIGELQLLPVWVNPNHLVATAKILLAGHRLRALGVIEGGVLIGTIGFEELVSSPDQEEVRRFVKPLSRTIAPDERTRTVADLMASEELDYLPVVERGQFQGMVTATMLLGDLGQSWDPLTGLPWSDALRDWGIHRLKEGREVTIVFLDLDDFGLYNKRFGHIVGDKVLTRVATYLDSATDKSSDLLARYGGDEFAIATIRTRRETEELLRSVERGLQGTLVAESDQPVSFSAGIFGGRRTKERENVHYSATLDAMINMASKEAQAAKDLKKGLGPAAPGAQRLLDGISVVEVFATGESSSAMDTVILSQKDKVASGVHSRGSASRAASVAEAAAKAISRLTDGLKLESLSVELAECEQGDRVVNVTALREGKAVSGTAKALGDLYKAVAEAVVVAASS